MGDTEKTMADTLYEMFYPNIRREEAQMIVQIIEILKENTATINCAKKVLNKTENIICALSIVDIPIQR